MYTANGDNKERTKFKGYCKVQKEAISSLAEGLTEKERFLWKDGAEIAQTRALSAEKDPGAVC